MNKRCKYCGADWTEGQNVCPGCGGRGSVNTVTVSAEDSSSKPKSEDFYSKRLEQPVKVWHEYKKQMNAGKTTYDGGFLSGQIRWLLKRLGMRDDTCCKIGFHD